MADYSKESTQSLKWKLWAHLQSNLQRGDIAERCKDPEHKKLVLHDIHETEKTISAIRQELIKRENAFEEKKYYCSESEESFTEAELRAYYNEDLESGSYDGSFCDWLNNCLYENNGTLEVPKLLATFRHKGHVFTKWSIYSDIGKTYIVRRCGAFWKAGNGMEFSADDGKYFWNNTEGGYYDMVKRISEDCIVLREEV